MTVRRSPFTVLFSGVIAAFCLPHAGWTGFVFDLTPWSFPVFSACLAVLFFALKDTSSRLAGFFLPFLWAFGFFVTGLSWVGNALLIEGNPYVWAYPLALVGLPLLLAPFWAVPLALARRWIAAGSLPAALLVFVIALSIGEFARGHLLTGFPWNLPGMIWIETPWMAQGFALVGPYGMTALTFLWTMSLIGIFARPLRPIFFFSLVSFFLVGLYGAGRMAVSYAPSSLPLQIRLVQANIPQSEKWESHRLMDHFQAHLALGTPPLVENSASPVLTLWPETALSPGYAGSPVVQDAVRTFLAKDPPGSVLVTGALLAEDRGRSVTYANSVIIYNADGLTSARYDKHHLVPFGEYIPFQRYVPFGPVARFTGLQAGPGPRVMTLPGLPPFVPLVCYEAIFPQALHVPAGSPPPRMIVNITNDSWYGDSPGPSQHLDQARARAIEQGLPLIRAAETGISALVDPFGKILSSIPYGQVGTVVAPLPDPLRGQTPYRRRGDILFFLILLILGGLVFRSRST